MITGASAAALIIILQKAKTQIFKSFITILKCMNLVYLFFRQDGVSEHLSPSFWVWRTNHKKENFKEIEHWERRYVGHLLFCIRNHLFSAAPGGDEELRKALK